MKPWARDHEIVERSQQKHSRKPKESITLNRSARHRLKTNEANWPVRPLLGEAEFRLRSCCHPAVAF